MVGQPLVTVCFDTCLCLRPWHVLFFCRQHAVPVPAASWERVPVVMLAMPAMPAMPLPELVQPAMPTLELVKRRAEREKQQRAQRNSDCTSAAITAAVTAAITSVVGECRPCRPCRPCWQCPRRSWNNQPCSRRNMCARIAWGTWPGWQMLDCCTYIKVDLVLSELIRDQSHNPLAWDCWFESQP